MDDHPFMEAEHIVLVQRVASERGWTIQRALTWMLTTAKSRHDSLTKYAIKRQAKESSDADLGGDSSELAGS